jgi:hypothetical protein
VHVVGSWVPTNTVRKRILDGCLAELSPGLVWQLSLRLRHRKSPEEAEVRVPQRGLLRIKAAEG